jgi:hypothetical protein
MRFVIEISEDGITWETYQEGRHTPLFNERYAVRNQLRLVQRRWPQKFVRQAAVSETLAQMIMRREQRVVPRRSVLA